MGFQNSSWNISVSCLVILAVSVLEMSCGKTDRQTNAAEHTTYATAVSVGHDMFVHSNTQTD